MRSSNYKHVKPLTNRRHARPVKKQRKISKLGSVILSAIVAVSAVVIPGVTLAQNVEAVTSVKNSAFAMGGSVFSEPISMAGDIKIKADKQEAEKTFETKATEEETQPQTEEETAAETEPQTEAPAVQVSKNEGLLSTANVDSSYSPAHVSLSYDDRDLLERLVMGEAGSQGYTGAALVAQTLRDTMNMTGITSVAQIIEEYQYAGSTDSEPNGDVKNAVAFVFDEDGYAVQHRLIYFYASDVISSEWHETQNFVVQWGSERFFDKW